MDKWNFNIKGNVHEISMRLESRLASADGFVFNLNSEHNSASFKLHKRGLYAFYLIFLNKIIVNGKILETATENETNLEISFKQYFLWKLIVGIHSLLGLALLLAIILKAGNSLFMYLLVGIVLSMGIILWVTVQNKFKKEVQEYKILITEILR